MEEKTGKEGAGFIPASNDAAIRAAVAVEREACAALAEEMDRPGGFGFGHQSDGFEIAAAIRART